MNTTMTDHWASVEEAVKTARLIAWDTCHKIYIMMDDQEVSQMRDYEYDPLLTSADTTPEQMLTEVLRWYNDSCSLRFIDVTSTGENGTEFYSLMGQFEDEEDDEDGEY